MDGNSHERDSTESPYENCQIGVGGPDLVNIRHQQHVVITQPGHHKPREHEPDDNDVTKRERHHGNDVRRADEEATYCNTESEVSKIRRDVARRERQNALRSAGARPASTYSLDGEQTNREWTSELFFSMTGNPHRRSCVDNTKAACWDCVRVPCMMCKVATRLGDPSYLPFVPCTGPAVRFKVRILGGITGSICDDCLVTACCWPCAVCQMHREMDNIGL